jgi:hypothetical protein
LKLGYLTSTLNGANHLKCIVEDEVRGILQAEAGVRAAADEAFNQRLKAIEDRLPPVGAT